MGSPKAPKFTELENDRLLAHDAYARAAGIKEPWKGQAKLLFPYHRGLKDKLLYERAKPLRRRQRDRAAKAAEAASATGECASPKKKAKTSQRRAARNSSWMPRRASRGSQVSTTLPLRFVGVHRTSGGKYRAQISDGGARRSLGTFDDEAVAASAYEAEAGPKAAAEAEATRIKKEGAAAEAAAEAAEAVAREARLVNVRRSTMVKDQRQFSPADDARIVGYLKRHKDGERVDWTAGQQELFPELRPRPPSPPHSRMTFSRSSVWVCGCGDFDCKGCGDDAPSGTELVALDAYAAAHHPARVERPPTLPRPRVSPRDVETRCWALTGSSQPPPVPQAQTGPTPAVWCCQCGDWECGVARGRTFDVHGAAGELGVVLTGKGCGGDAPVPNGTRRGRMAWLLPAAERAAALAKLESDEAALRGLGVVSREAALFPRKKPSPPLDVLYVT